MIALPNKLIVFGGFYDNGKAIINYNDLHVFDLSSMTWSEVKRPSKGTQWPNPRAGHQFMLHSGTNSAILYGGVRMEVKSKETKEAKNTSYFNDCWKLDLSNYSWSKVRAKGAAPNPRAGMTMAIHRERAVVFGGSTDIESEFDFATTCHNDLFSLSLGERNVWNEVKVQKGAPLPRRHAQMVVKGNNLIVFGGVLEQKKKEITLNDWYSLDLKKQNAWKPLVEMDLSSQVWLASDDEEEKEESGSEPEEIVEEVDPNAEVVDVDVPMDNESLKEYFARSREYWVKFVQDQADGEEISPKALKRLAFQQCKDRFEEYE